MFVVRFASAFVLISSAVSVTFDCYPCECKSEDCNITEADCSASTINIQIGEIPQYFSSYIEHLKLTGQELEVLEENVFENANLIGLKILYMQQCQLSAIHRNAFANMSKLTYLDASDNNLSEIDSATFFWTKNLKSLDLRNNAIQNLTFTQNLTQLESLLLSSNNITNLDENIFFNNPKLESLVLSMNKIEKLPNKLFSHLNNLKYLHLSYNKISRIPNKIFQNNSELRNFFLDYNAITELPENLFNNITSLNVLDLEHNKIRYIPENIFQNLVKLEIIQLMNNEIESFPNNTFKNLSRLHILDLSYNKINAVNTGFVEYSSCENGFRYVSEILLNHNNISVLPAGLLRKYCQDLRVDLSYNQISSIDPNAFSNAHIISLNLTQNKISVLSSNTFKSINILLLSFNNLSVLPNGIFDSVNIRLSLNSNNFKTISSKWFGNNKYVTILLANNSIQYFELNVTNFYYLDMSNNPINCNCKLRRQHELLTRKIVKIQCAYPLALKNKSWSNLKSNQFACEPEIKDNFIKTINGTTRQIGCEVYASPAPNIQWLKYNKTIQNNDTAILQTRTNETEDFYWYNLTFTKEAADFAGQYSCVLNNAGGSADMNFTVLQLVQPTPKPNEEGTNAVVENAIWISIVVLILIVVLVALARMYRKRRQRINERANSVSNVSFSKRLYDPLGYDTGSIQF